jgi:hypothetical protein
MSQEVHMTKVITAAVLGLAVAVAAGALAQQSRTTSAVTLHIISPTGEATTFAIDRGDLTLAVAENEVRLAVTGDARVRPASGRGAEIQMTHPTLVFSRAIAGSQSPVFQLSADRVTTSKPESH